MAIFGDVVSVNFHSQTDLGQDISNTIHLTRAGGSAPSLADLTTLATDVTTYFSATYRATMANQFTWLSTTVKQVVDPTTVDNPLEYVNPVNLAGTRGAITHNSPASLCALIQLKTPVASRRARGHIFLAPSYAQNEMNGDVYNGAAGYAVGVIAFAAKLATGCSPTPTWTGTGLSTWYLGCYSKRAAQLGVPHAFACTAAVWSPQVRFLRSRERGTH